MDKVIEDFILGIKKGPFKFLKGYKGDAASKIIAKQNEIIGDIYDCAVYQAWLDMNRTVDGAGKAKKASCEAARKAAAEALRNYFKNEPQSKEDLFDDWHFKTCSKIFKPAGLTLGQAQKILNMAFKYLFCCEDIRSKKQNHFTFCHMPLDSFTLNWYKNHCAAAQYSGEKWSQINDPDLYYSIEKEIREELKEKHVLSEEFSIWADEKQKAELQELTKHLKRLGKDTTFQQKLTDSERAALRELMDKLLKK